MRFAGKTVVITGAASGIGKATVLKFAGEGAIVYAADIDEAGGATVVAQSNGDVRFQRCDVCHVPDIQALMDRAAAETGGIDVVFNNAAAVGDRAPIDEIEADGWDRTMDLILRSVAMGIRYSAPHMKGRPSTTTGTASIVNTASVASLGSGYSPTAYAVAKAGVLHLSKLAATDLAQYGIRVNAICPGFINTNIFGAGLGIAEELHGSVTALVAEISQHAQPIARGGQPDDIANMVAFLASSEASFITGTHMLVDGGITTGPRHAWDPNTPSMFEALAAMDTAAP